MNPMNRVDEAQIRAMTDVISPHVKKILAETGPWSEDQKGCIVAMVLEVANHVNLMTKIAQEDFGETKAASIRAVVLSITAMAAGEMAKLGAV